MPAGAEAEAEDNLDDVELDDDELNEDDDLEGAEVVSGGADLVNARPDSSVQGLSDAARQLPQGHGTPFDTQALAMLSHPSPSQSL